MIIRWQAVMVAVLISGSTACAADNDAPSAKAAASSTSVESSDNALPPAVQGLEECPAPIDKPFELRRGDDRIHGFARGTGDRVAVLTHQFRGTPCDLAGLGAVLAEDGWRVVAWTTDTSPTPRTLRRLVAHERRAGATTVVLVGASVGGATSLVAAGAIKPWVDAVVALSASDYAMESGDVAAGAERYPGPLMAVAGELDAAFAELPEELGRLHDGPEAIDVLPGTADHGKDFVQRRDDPLVKRVVAFLDDGTSQQ